MYVCVLCINRFNQKVKIGVFTFIVRDFTVFFWPHTQSSKGRTERPFAWKLKLYKYTNYVKMYYVFSVIVAVAIFFFLDDKATFDRLA